METVTRQRLLREVVLLVGEEQAVAKALVRQVVAEEVEVQASQLQQRHDLLRHLS